MTWAWPRLRCRDRSLRPKGRPRLPSSPGCACVVLTCPEVLSAVPADDPPTTRGRRTLRASTRGRPGLRVAAMLRAPVRALLGKHVFLTGAASGIGRATALAAAREGAVLFLTDVD